MGVPRLVSSDESNPNIIIIKKMKLILYNESINPLEKVMWAQRLLSFLESIFKSEATGAVFMYLLGRGAATSWLIQVDLDMPESTAHRALKRLRKLGLITPEWRIPKAKHSPGGPRPYVWALLDAHTEDVARAARDHQRALSPKYRIAEEVAQSILDDYITPRQVTEINYREIIIHVKELNIPFRTPDIADLAATYLNERGIKVWR